MELILRRFPGPVVLTANRERVILFAGMAAIGIAATWWLLGVAKDYREVIAGWLGLLFCAACGLQLLSLLVPGRAQMTLDQNGVTIIHGIFRWGYRWSDISDISIWTMHTHMQRLSCVIFNGRATSYVPTLYDVGAEDMKRLLESWRDRALAAASART